jgi:drug/metabolite transporter (DMT)-like permease
MYVRRLIVVAYPAMCIIWGTTFLAMKANAHSLGPVLGVGLRFTAAGLLLLAISAITKQLRAPREYPWRAIVVIAIFLIGLSHSLIYVAESKLDSGVVAVLGATLPFLTIALSRALFGTRIPVSGVLGAAIAFAGICVISLKSHVGGAPLYVLAAFASVASLAYANVYTKQYAHYNPLVLLPPAMVVAGVPLTIVGLGLQRVNWALVFEPTSVVALLYLAVVGTGISFLLFMLVLRELPPWAVGMASLIVPVIALFVGWALGGEAMDGSRLLGAFLVLVGVGVSLADPSVAPRETRVLQASRHSGARRGESS